MKSECWCPSHPHRSRVSYYAVFDGHNGARASRFAAENLHHNIALKFPKGKQCRVPAPSVALLLLCNHPSVIVQ